MVTKRAHLFPSVFLCEFPIIKLSSNFSSNFEFEFEFESKFYGKFPNLIETKLKTALIPFCAAFYRILDMFLSRETVWPRPSVNGKTNYFDCFGWIFIWRALNWCIWQRHVLMSTGTDTGICTLLPTFNANANQRNVFKRRFRCMFSALLFIITTTHVTSVTHVAKQWLLSWWKFRSFFSIKTFIQTV